MNYTIKQYDDHWEHVFPFADFADKENFWIKTSYLIHKGYFRSEIGKPLDKNLLAENRKTVFRDISPNFDFSKFELIDDEPDFANAAKTIYRVTETYGYAPDKVYIFPDRANWQRPGLYDTGAGHFAKNMSLQSSEAGTETHVINVDNRDGKLVPGNKVQFAKDFYQQMMQWWYRQESNVVSILYATATTIVVPFFTWTVKYEDGTIGGSIPSTSGEGGFYAPGAKWVVQLANVRLPFTETYTVEKHTRFFKYNGIFPHCESAFVVRSGGEPVDTLTSATAPTLQQYNAAIGTGARLLVTQEDAKPFKGNIWQKNSLYLPYI